MPSIELLEALDFNQEHIVITPMIETTHQKLIRILFLKGQNMPSHKSKFPISVQVLSGLIDFGVGEEKSVLKAGSVIFLEDDIMHDLNALEDSVVLLTLSKEDSVARVQGVVFKQV